MADTKKKTFNQMGDVLHRTLTALVAFDWETHFPKIELHYPDGSLKYQGMLFGMKIGGVISLSEIGNLHSLRTSQETLGAKFKILDNNRKFVSSIEGRVPEDGLWGGALLAFSKNKLLFGVTGWPELIDLLLTAKLMVKFAMLTPRGYARVINPSHPKIKEAMEDVGINEMQFDDIRVAIVKIVDQAYREIYA